MPDASEQAAVLSGLAMAMVVVDGVEAVLAAVAAIARQRAGAAGGAAALTARRR